MHGVLSGASSAGNQPVRRNSQLADSAIPVDRKRSASRSCAPASCSYALAKIAPLRLRSRRRSSTLASGNTSPGATIVPSPSGITPVIMPHQLHTFVTENFRQPQNCRKAEIEQTCADKQVRDRTRSTPVHTRQLCRPAGPSARGEPHSVVPIRPDHAIRRPQGYRPPAMPARCFSSWHSR